MQFNDTSGFYLKVILRLIDGEWEGVWFKDLKVDDVFKEKGTDDMFIALDNPVWNDGTWGIPCERILGVISV